MDFRIRGGAVTIKALIHATSYYDQLTIHQLCKVGAEWTARAHEGCLIPNVINGLSKRRFLARVLSLVLEPFVSKKRVHQRLLPIHQTLVVDNRCRVRVHKALKVLTDQARKLFVLRNSTFVNSDYFRSTKRWLWMVSAEWKFTKHSRC